MPFSDDLLEILDPLIRRLNLLLLFSQLLLSCRDLLSQLLILMFQGQLPWLGLLVSLWLEVSHRSVHDVSDAEIVVSAVYVFVLHGLQALDLFFKELQFFHEPFVLLRLLLGARAPCTAESSCEIVVLWVLLLLAGKLLWQISIPYISAGLVRLELTCFVGLLIHELLLVELQITTAVLVVALR